MHDFVSLIFDYDLHAKLVASLVDATVGALQVAHLAVGALGRALAIAKELDANGVPFVIGEGRPEIVVALDLTDFDQDNQSTFALYLVTKHPERRHSCGSRS